MISVQCNKNIEDYKSDVVAGFDLKETLSIGAGILIGVIVIFVMYKLIHVPLVFCPYIAIPFVIIPIIGKFYRKNGMGFLENRKKIRELNSAKVLLYKTKNAASYSRYLVAANQHKENTSDDQFEKMLKKVKIGVTILIILIVGCITTLIVFKMCR